MKKLWYLVLIVVALIASVIGTAVAFGGGNPAP